MSLTQLWVFFLVLTRLQGELLTEANFKGLRIGSRVVRGPGWNYSDQDGGAGNEGSVIELRPWRRAFENGTAPLGMIAARVKWDVSGKVNAYRWDAPGTGVRDLTLVGWRPLSSEEATLPSYLEGVQVAAAARESASLALIPALRGLWEGWGGPGWRVQRGWRDALAMGGPDSAIEALPCGGAAGALGRGKLGWEGVVCSLDNTFVVGLDLSGNGLVGNLSSPISSATTVVTTPAHLTTTLDLLPSGLVSLSLARNALRGPLPTSLCRFPNLQFLDLSSNHLEGPIPPCLGDLTRLEVLYLANNALTGPLPPTLGKLRALKGLHLHGNEGLQPPLPLALKELLGGVKHLTLPLALQQALKKKEA